MDKQRGDLTASLSFCEPPVDLLQHYEWKKGLRAEMERLADPIDLSVQIHDAMRCLGRIELAFLQAVRPEIAAAVATFKSIVGDLNAYPSRPLLLNIVTPPPLFHMISSDLEIERVLEAEELAGA